MFDCFDVLAEAGVSRPSHLEQSRHNKCVEHDQQDGRNEIYKAEPQNQKHACLELLPGRSRVRNTCPE